MKRPFLKIVIVTLLCISTIFVMATMFLCRRIWEVQTDEFRAQSVRIVSHLSSMGELYLLPHTDQFALTYESQVFRTAQEESADIWVCDPMGNILLAYGPEGETQTLPITAAELRSKILPYLQDGFSDMEQKGTTVFTDCLLYDSVTFGYPIHLDGIEGAVIGVVLMHMTQPSFSANMISVIGICAMAFLFTLAFAVVLLVYLYYRYGYVFSGILFLDAKKPLRTMEESFHGQDETARALMRLERQLNRQEASETAFVANASHELRSPMTSIQGFAQGMLDGVIPSEDAPHYLTIMIEESRRLNNLIRDLLDLSRIESQLTPKSFVSFELHERIRQVLIRFEGRIEAKNILPSIEFATQDAYVLGDPDRLEQVLVNLIDNAIKYTPEGGSIRIWTYPTLEDQLMVGVTDTGYGISQEDLPYIFDRFYKVDTSHTGHVGTGLGLAIVRQILERHETTIHVHSILGRGTTFSFSLRRIDTQTE